MDIKNFLFSVVIPVYNSESIVDKTVDQVYNFFTQNKLNFEIILVNDGSSDNSWNVIKNLAEKYKEVTAIKLLKNYGQHNANLCGFREANGEYIITMDDDLQNPPEEIYKLINAAKQGYDLVIGRFDIKKHTFIRRMGSKFVGWLNLKVFNVKDNLVLSNFRIIHRNVVDLICKDKSVNPYIPGLILKYSQKRCNVLVRHQERAVGKSGYTWRKILHLVASILFNYSTIPLRLSAAFGFIISGLSFILGMLFFTRALFDGSIAPGWPSLIVLMSFFNGVLILMISVIGEYLIRILREVSSHNSYEISEIIKK